MCKVANSCLSTNVIFFALQLEHLSRDILVYLHWFIGLFHERNPAKYGLTLNEKDADLSAKVKKKKKNVFTCHSLEYFLVIFSASAAQRVPAGWIQRHADLHLLRQWWQAGEQRQQAQLYCRKPFQTLPVLSQRYLDHPSSSELCLSIMGLQSPGRSDQWSRLWFGSGSRQWGRCSGCWWSVSDSILPELQERERREGHLQEAAGCVCQEERGLPDCWGNQKEMIN